MMKIETDKKIASRIRAYKRLQKNIRSTSAQRKVEKEGRILKEKYPEYFV